MGKIADGHISLVGIYEWGKGWDSEKSLVWDKFWTEKSESHKEGWLVGYDDSIFGRQFYLVGLYGSVYLHPMGMEFIFHTSNSAETETLEHPIKEMAKLFDELVEVYKIVLGIDLKYSINWNVMKANYMGIDNKSYVIEKHEGLKISNS